MRRQCYNVEDEDAYLVDEQAEQAAGNHEGKAITFEQGGVQILHKRLADKAVAGDEIDRKYRRREIIDNGNVRAVTFSLYNASCRQGEQGDVVVCGCKAHDRTATCAAHAEYYGYCRREEQAGSYDSLRVADEESGRIEACVTCYEVDGE